MNDMNTTDRALGWDDEFTNEQQEFVLLPEGDYAFEVTGMERARFEGSAKLPPCSMAKLTLKIFGGAKGDTTVTHRLYLHTKTQGLLGAFFESIGQCKRGETFRPRWNEVVGAKGIHGKHFRGAAVLPHLHSVRGRHLRKEKHHVHPRKAQHHHSQPCTRCCTGRAEKGWFCHRPRLGRGDGLF